MKKFNLKYQIAAGVILIIGGTLALLSNYIKEKRDVVFSEMNLALSTMSNEKNYIEEDLDIEEEIEEVEKDIAYIKSKEELPELVSYEDMG